MNTENKKLTPEELKYLFDFVGKNVKYYDLQCEMVDHMATGIEEQWQTDDTILFHDAFKKEFSRFGISGFVELEEKRYKTLVKRYHKIVWKLFKSFFKLPQIIGILLSLYVVHLAMLYIPGHYFANIFVVYIVASLGFSISFYFWGYLKLKRKQQVFVFERIIYGESFLGMAGLLYNFILWNRVYTIILSGNMEAYKGWMVSTLLVLLTIFIYIGCYSIPKNGRKYLEEMYPEYERVQRA